MVTEGVTLKTKTKKPRLWPRAVTTNRARRIHKKAAAAQKAIACPIVGIGGSAGGFEATIDLLRHLPAKNGMTFVVVQHLDPHHASKLASLLGKATDMRVTDIEKTTEPQPNTVYSQPPNKCVVIKDGTLRLVRRTHQINVAIDQFLESLAEACGSRAIGVVLSGSGSDGTARLRAIKARLVGRSRRQLIGSTFAVCVAKEDVQRFLNHLFECHSSDGPVVTELSLKRADGKEFPVQLSSTAALTLMKDGAQSYQTAIVDLTERECAGATRSEAVRQQGALYELAQRHQEAKTLGEIYDAALDAILTALSCDRASILLYDQQQVIRFVAWRGLSQKYRKAVEGHSPWKPDAENPQPVCIADVDLADIPKSLKSTIRREEIRAVAFIPLISNQKLIGKFMIYQNTPHLFTEDELKLATTIARQLAQAIQHKRDEDALRESEARIRATVEQVTAGVACCDTTGRITFANRTLCQMLGYSQSEILGQSFVEFTHPHHVADNVRRFRQMIHDGKPYEIEKRYVRKNGSVLWADVSASAVLGPDGKTQSTVSVIVDITARKKAEAALQRAKQLLELRVRTRTLELRKANNDLKSEIERRKGLEGEILAVSDREQQRLGQELHDGICQHLTAVAFMARSVALRLKQHRVIDAADIEKIGELVNNAAIDTRNLSRALHRFDVDAAGLVRALQDLVDREIWRTPCRLDHKPSFRIEDDATAAHLYRIAREAVINANKHAQAREIVVRLERSPRGMVLHVIDDGVGFPMKINPSEGLGYHLMKYRAQLMGGHLEIHSRKGDGTRVSCYLPKPAPRSKRVQNGDAPTDATPSVSSRPVVRDLIL